MAYGDGDRGVGGWLAFFLVTLGIFSPAFGLISLARELNDPQSIMVFQAWPSLKTAEIAVVVFQIVLCWFVCYRFLRVFNWTTVVIGVAALVILALAAVVVQPMLIAGVSGLPAGMVYRAIGVELIRPIVYSVLWSSYLLVSKRVRRTYDPAQSAVEVDQVFE